MCLAPGGTPERCRQIVVLHQKPPKLNFHDSLVLLRVFKSEVTSGAYNKPDIYHPAATESFTYAASNMETLRKALSVPVCDVIEDISNFFNMPDKEAFTPSGQVRRKYLGNFRSWISFVLEHPSNLPITGSYLKDLLPTLELEEKNQLRKSQMHASLKVAENVIRQHQQQYAQVRSFVHGNPLRQRLVGADYPQLLEWVKQGYTLSQCRQLVVQPDLFRTPGSSQSIPLWRQDALKFDELASIQHILETGVHHKKRTFNNRRRRVTAAVLKLLEQPETGLPLVRKVWPAARLEDTSEAQASLARIHAEIMTLEAGKEELADELRTFSVNDEDLETRIQPLEARIQAFVATLPLAA